MDHWETIASYPEKEFNEYIERLREKHPNSNEADAIVATRNRMERDKVFKITILKKFKIEEHFEIIASLPEKQFNDYIESLKKNNPNSNMLIEKSSELGTEPIDLENKSVYQYQGRSDNHFDVIASYPEEQFNEYIAKLRKSNPDSKEAYALIAARQSLNK